jgi:hypothetical protein
MDELSDSPPLIRIRLEEPIDDAWWHRDEQRTARLGEPTQAASRGVPAWARALEAPDLANLSNTVSSSFLGLNVRIPGDTAIATAWIAKDIYLQLWRTMLDRRARDAIEAHRAVDGSQHRSRAIGKAVLTGLIRVLTGAYRRATGRGCSIRGRGTGGARWGQTQRVHDSAFSLR